jgi:DNA-binding MarR family transcriptional regulator
MLLYLMWQVQTQAGRVVVRLCETEFGITRREWRVLAILATHEGVLSSQLADLAGLDRARTSRAVTNLAAKRLIVRTPRPGDRREVQLHLSPAGRALHKALLPRVAQINQELLSVLSSPEVHSLHNMLQRLRKQAHAMAAAHSAAPQAHARE